MTKVAQIEDRGAAVAWSPVGDHADVIALGAKESGSTGFDDYGGELELFDLGITSATKPAVIGSVKTTSRFSSIGWTTGTNALSSSFSMGIIAGGMDNGAVNIYNPAKLVEGGASDTNSCLLSSIERKNGAISALQFNPHASSANLLATGSSSGEILITSLDNPDQPTVTIPSSGDAASAVSTAEITQMAWNTEVPHIVASGAGNGIATIWDLRQNKPWCELRCEVSGAAVADLAWNPSNGMHLITASSDDRNPVLKMWDLRASMSMPLATMEGHLGGILSIDWCPHDDSLLLSCGKGGRTILWDVHTLKPIADLPNDGDGVDNLASPARNSSELYTANSGLTSSQQKRNDVKWSPLRKGVVSTCSFDRKVQAHSVIGIATKSGRPPKWMKPASGVSCGFGGSIVSFGTTGKQVAISNHVEETELKEAVYGFESAIANGDYVGFCAKQAVSAASVGDAYDAELWGFMQILFGENTRHNLLNYLGFEPEDIARKASDFNDDEIDMSTLSLESKGTLPMSKKVEDAVSKALFVGNFEAAVECCIRSGNLADALVLASCGGAELWAKTQSQYFASETGKRPFLSIVSAVMHNKLDEFTASSYPSSWAETLAILCTYSTEQEFRPLCETLGDRLVSAGDTANASLCYLCALNLDKASQYWEYQLNGARSSSENYLALHSFAVKVAVFMQAGAQNDQLPMHVSNILFQYAKVVSEQGFLSSAAKYCWSSSQECKELRDRLYRSKDTQLCTIALGPIPEFPFAYVNVGVAPILSQAASQKVLVQPSSNTNHNSYTPSQAQTTNNGYTSGAGIYQTVSQSNNQQMPSTGYGTNTSIQKHDSEVNGQYGKSQQISQMPTNETQLPSGWTALQDPASGRTYYANSSTGETTWEIPVSQISATVSPQINATPSKTAMLASKYGDGFVTSASHPELAAQYGNVGTSNPYTDSARPGTAVVNKVQKPPVSGTFNLKKLAQVADSTNYKPLVDDLLVCVTSLADIAVGPSEKKQLAEVQKAAAIFSKRLAQVDVPTDVADKVGQIVAALKNNDFLTATGVHTSLVNTVWKQHKDWLKGLKFLIQMTSKSNHNARTQGQWAM
uniref:WW domain-containing protein n=1 Tax=Chaetoceros debilis TaxID=122233 RepID=A0A7S3PXW7_9STRA|mmetsp:Transcript_30333/g.46425  ORF Transcript_30333/g.46425 Transcript_30333/m.46425 type:complete len:1088 (-) Transcript_30333:47-3310(-)|eukprot:CAMPEP_0194117856 /NCGR_PEP_ID=MMETSP0150-20130528/33130_1 /TAXON_ID=122233 /ORGANISM="Chaetoceros debilis, Strain MM31A-1" /LENGTH=1087 /DNA_ID=CAMNT_0038809035 /DNA_START=100 /DNA_END=3363 /DNA_ORIENTATION=+